LVNDLTLQLQKLQFPLLPLPIDRASAPLKWLPLTVAELPLCKHTAPPRDRTLPKPLLQTLSAVNPCALARVSEKVTPFIVIAELFPHHSDPPSASIVQLPLLFLSTTASDPVKVVAVIVGVDESRKQSPPRARSTAVAELFRKVQFVQVPVTP
jgi:hypothetical protein